MQSCVRLNHVLRQLGVELVLLRDVGALYVEGQVAVLLSPQRCLRFGPIADVLSWGKNNGAACPSGPGQMIPTEKLAL